MRNAILFALMLVGGTVFAQKHDANFDFNARLHAVAQKATVAPEAVTSDASEQIKLTEAQRIIEDEDALLKRKEMFSGDLESIRKLLSALRSKLETPTPTPLQAKVAALNAQEQATAKAKAELAAEMRSVLSMLGGANCPGGCGPNCPCPPGTNCVNGECVPVRTQPCGPCPKGTTCVNGECVTSSVCETTGLPYIH